MLHKTPVCMVAMIALLPLSAISESDTGSAFAPVKLLDASDFGESGANGDQATTVKVDAYGDTIVAGSLNGYRGSFVAKLRGGASNMIWSLAFPELQEASIALDASANVYIVGTRLGQSKIELRKLSPSGDIVWESGFSEGSARSLELTTDSHGNVIVSGTLSRTYYGDEFAVFKFDRDGAFLWHGTIPSGVAQHSWSRPAIDVQVDSRDAIVAVGITAAPVFSAIPIFTVAKWSAAGELLWQRALGEGIARSVAIDSADDVIAVGSLDNRFSVNKFDSTGMTLWSLDFAGTSQEGEAFDVAIDGTDSVVAVGSLGNIDTKRDFAAIKVSPAGTVKWRQELDGDPLPSLDTLDSRNDYASAVAVDSVGNVYASGAFWRMPPGNWNGRPELSAVMWSADGELLGIKDLPQNFRNFSGTWRNSIAVSDPGCAAVVGWVVKPAADKGMDGVVALTKSDCR